MDRAHVHDSLSLSFAKLTHPDQKNSKLKGRNVMANTKPTSLSHRKMTSQYQPNDESHNKELTMWINLNNLVIIDFSMYPNIRGSHFLSKCFGAWTWRASQAHWSFFATDPPNTIKINPQPNPSHSLHLKFSTQLILKHDSRLAMQYLFRSSSLLGE